MTSRAILRLDNSNRPIWLTRKELFFTYTHSIGVMGILVSILVGAVAGWLADLVFKRFSFSIWIQILLGIAGSFVGSWLLGNDLQVMLGLPELPARIVTAFLGALVILGIVALVKSRQNR